MCRKGEEKNEKIFTRFAKEKFCTFLRKVEERERLEHSVRAVHLTAPPFPSPLLLRTVSMRTPLFSQTENRLRMWKRRRKGVTLHPNFLFCGTWLTCRATTFGLRGCLDSGHTRSGHTVYLTRRNRKQERGTTHCNLPLSRTLHLHVS